MSRGRRAAQGTSAHGYEELSADAIAEIDGKEFEELCRELLDIERQDRHGVDAELFGPQGDCVADGGSDISLHVRSAPRQSKEDYEAEVGLSLTEDAPGITVYSCKSGPNLRALLVRDARERSERVVDALLAGGRFTILTNRPLDPDARSKARRGGRAPAKKGGKGAAPRQPLTLSEQITEELWKRMKERKPDVEGPGPRIRFVDANGLKCFLARRKPVEIRSSFRDKLGVRQIEGLASIDDWNKWHRQERERDDVRFERDPLRADAIQEIRQTLSSGSDDPYARIVWLVGPPGVGKTRLALEALNGGDALGRRVLVALDDQRAIMALRDQDLLALCPSVVLVVDDCPALQVDAVISQFALRASPRSALVVITPRSHDFAPGSQEARTARAVKHVVRLDPMDEAAQRRLIEHEIGPLAVTDQVDRIARLTGGFPWFAVLVAREIRENRGRLVALGGLEAALSTQAVRYGDEQRDGPVAVPTLSEAREARIGAWRLLITLTGDDDSTVSARARAMIAAQLRNAVRVGLGGEVAGLVSSVLGGFSPAELVVLREEIDAAFAYDRAWIEGSPEVVGAWAALARAAAPRSFAERLRQVVGTWGYPDREEPDVDEALARECLSRTEGIEETLDWLESKEAVRAPAFVRTLGRIDVGRVWSEPLVDRARRGGCPAAGMLADYLQGWQDGGREAEADDVLRAHRDDPRLAAATALAVHRLGATDERAGWISTDLCAGRLDDGALDLLALGKWTVRPGDHALATLLRSLLDRGSRAAYGVVLSLLVGTAEDAPGPRWRAPLRQALEGLAEGDMGAQVEWRWERSALRLAKMGEVALVLNLTLRRLRAGGARGGRFGWPILHACAAHDPVATWHALAPLLEQRSSDAHAWAIELRFHRLVERLPADEILGWVGRDSRRAALAAELATVHGQVLPPLVRSLISRFGADSPAARVLAGRASSTSRTLVASLAELTAEQIALARGWARDRDPEVRRWAEGLIEDLERSHEEHDAYEEHEKRRWGT